jgi:glutamate/tyrosine decarboxylase-like PLP-dependent enzyme
MNSVAANSRAADRQTRGARRISRAARGVRHGRPAAARRLITLAVCSSMRIKSAHTAAPRAWLVSAWGQNTGYHSPTPATAAIEAVAERWLLEVLDLPRGSSVGFSTGATVANAIGLAAARTGVLLEAGWDPDADGLFGAPPVEVLIGADAHSSVFSSLQLQPGAA